MRLFTALEPAESVQEQISRLYLESARQVRWTPQDQLHLTLVFIGDITAQDFEPIIESLAEIEFSPLTLKSTHIGWFRSGTIWLGVTATDELLKLQRQISQRLRQSGINLPRRRYVPHITLGRCDVIEPGLMKQLEERALGFHCEFECSEFVLKSSTLRPQGAEHITEVTFLAETEEGVREQLRKGRL